MKKQKSGLYRTKVRIGYDPQGKPVDKWISGRTKAEVETKKHVILTGYVTGTPSGGAPLFGTAVIEWYNSFKEPFIAQSRKQQFRTAINNYLFPALAEKRLNAITRADIQNVLNGMSGMSPAIPCTVLLVCRTIFRQAVSDGYMNRDITTGLSLPQFRKAKEKRALTPDERRKIADLSESIPWLAILYYTGMRGGEMRALTWADIDLKRRTIRVRHSLSQNGKTLTPGKTAASRRDVPISDQLYDILRRCVGIPTAHITGEPWSLQTLERAFKDIGIAPDLTVHALRHNFITMCWEAGVDALVTSKVVGHANPSITLRIYTHLDTANYSDQISSVFNELHKSCTADRKTSKKQGI